MKRFNYVMLASAMFLAAGCSSGVSADSPKASVIAEVIEEETEGAKEREKDEGGQENPSIKAAEESLKAAEESLQEREESLKAAEESLAEAQSSQAEIPENREITYHQLVTAPNEYVNKNIIYRGEIIRSAKIDSASVQIVLAVEGNDNTQLVGEYRKSIVADVLEVGDWIRVSGQFAGMMRYRMNSGNIENLPTITIREIDQVVKVELETQLMTQPETREETTEEETSAEEMTETVEMSTEPESRTSPVISAGQP